MIFKMSFGQKVSIGFDRIPAAKSCAGRFDRCVKEGESLRGEKALLSLLLNDCKRTEIY
jgi:hypothetical protein